MTRQSTPTTDEMHTIPTLEDILRAKDVLNGFVRKTPLQRSDTFSKLVGTNIFLKLESLQRTGSFKVRGAFVKVNTLSEEQKKYGVIAASAGNHAQGVAYAASIKNIPCTIIMPQNHTEQRGFCRDRIMMKLGVSRKKLQRRSAKQ